MQTKCLFLGDPDKTTMQELYGHFGLDGNTADFTGHALALQLNDE